MFAIECSSCLFSPHICGQRNSDYIDNADALCRLLDQPAGEPRDPGGIAAAGHALDQAHTGQTAKLLLGLLNDGDGRRHHAADLRTVEAEYADLVRDLYTALTRGGDQANGDIVIGREDGRGRAWLRHQGDQALIASRKGVFAADGKRIVEDHAVVGQCAQIADQK